MSKNTDGKFTVQIANTIPKMLHSRDSAERLVRTVIGLWRVRSEEFRKNPATLILDFNGIGLVSESAACALIEFQREFSEDKNLTIEFSNLSTSVSETFAIAEKSLRRVSKRIKTHKTKGQNSFVIEV